MIASKGHVIQCRRSSSEGSDHRAKESTGIVGDLVSEEQPRYLTAWSGRVLFGSLSAALSVSVFVAIPKCQDKGLLTQPRKFGEFSCIFLLERPYIHLLFLLASSF